MAWLDNRFWCHPKVTGLSDRAYRVYVNGVTYSAGFGTDGILTPKQQRTLGATPRARRELVDAQLWDEISSNKSSSNDEISQENSLAPKRSIRIHDWSDYNGQRDEKRRRDRDRKRRQREREARPSRGQARDMTRDIDRDVPRVREGGRAPDDGSDGVTDDRPTSEAAAKAHSRSSTSVASSEADIGTSSGANCSIEEEAGEAPRELDVIRVAERYGTARNVIEPIALQLTAESFADVVEIVDRRVRTGSVSNPAGLLVALLRGAAKQAERDDLHPPLTLAEDLERDAIWFAGNTPVEVALDLLERKARRGGIDGPELEQLIAHLAGIYAAQQADTEAGLIA